MWVLFLAIPGVFLWQLLLTLLVRARGTVRAHRAVSWWDVLGFGVWHVLVISLGFFNPEWWAVMMVVAILVGVGLFWLALWQLWSEAKPTRMVLRTSGGVAYLPAMAPEDAAEPQEIIVISEKQAPPAV